MIRAGELIHRITIQKPDPASPKDSAGQRVIAWLDVAVDIAAKVTPISGAQAFLAAQKRASTTHTVKIRYAPVLADVDPTHRVLFRGRTLYLDDVTNTEERNVELILQCTEGLRTTA